MGFWSDFFASLDPTASEQARNAASDRVNSDFGNKVHGQGSSASQVINQGANDILTSLGIIPQRLSPGAPGTSLDTSQADAERMQLTPLLSQLEQQAQTGGGAWEQALKNSEQQAEKTGMALGQSRPDLDNISKRGNIINSQAGAQQRAIGEGNILRAQSQQGAQDQLAQLYGGMASGDLSQASAAASANQATREMNAALAQQAKQAGQGMLSGAGQAAMAALSKGGEVPGHPHVFGDDERNDTVKAKLSPGEIVIPRSISEAPDAPEKAAAFVAKVKGRMGGHNGHFAGGGDTGLSSGQAPSGGDLALIGLLPHIGVQQYYNKAGLQPEGASIENGGLLNTDAYNQSRDNLNRVAGQQMMRALGYGPSVAPQMQQNEMDSAIQAGMQPSSRSAAGAQLANVVAQQQHGGAEAAQTRGREQSAAQRAFMDSILRQRSQDMAMAQAAQQAALRNTELNAGLNLQAQSDLRNLLSGAGQAASSIAAAGGRETPGGTPNADALATESGYPSSPDEWNSYSSGPERGSASDLSGGENYAKGGAIRKPKKDPEEHTPGKNYMPQVPVVDFDKSLANKKASFPDEEASPHDFTPQYADGGKIPKPLKEVDPLIRGGDVGTPVDLANDPLAGMGTAPPPQLPDVAGWAKEHPVVARAALQSIAGPLTLPFGVPGVVGTDIAFKANQPPLPPGVQAGPPPEAPKPPLKPPPQQPPPAAPPKPATLGGSPYVGLKDIEAGQAKQAQAARDVAEAQGMEARGKAQALIDAEQMLKNNAIEQRDIQARGHAAAEKMLNDFRSATDEIRNIDTTVDPGRFWASKSTGQKILGGIGLALGALGAGPSGINRSAAIIQDAINRDVEAQKSQAQLAMAKGQQRLSGLQNLYSLQHQVFQDDVAATAAAKAAGLELALNKVQQWEAKAADPIAKAQATALAGQLQTALGVQKGTMATRAAEIGLKQQEIGAKQGGGGLLTNEGKNIIGTAESYNRNIQDNGQKLLSLIEQYGTAEKVSPGVEKQMQQLAYDMANDGAKLADPNSAARPSEVEAQAKLIFEPGFLQRQGAATNAIKSYMRNAEQRTGNVLKGRGVNPG